ncbi:alpha/beta fold hydrolase [Sphingomonas jatrophae]|uniref:Pimeloyl-ACP methyl ester carboxylesterase n=1 Tax=Sphingomonas jatrophae TaxID=1166337 RepID=A0A1I6JW50_9SPHN|nr:alpha/beta hydrolase [Sphingomonas jatrophae]SFR83173.1 Pimeloyl-ACP methyl ester carboxylesterase [Sphingomonas jatrophae]
MPYVKAKDSTDLYVKDWGSGRPVVLMHGWPLNADSWDDTAFALAKAGHRVIAYDRRGFGRSGQPWSGYDYDTFADDLATVLEVTGAQDATLVGFSMGGGEVARYMSRHGGKGVHSAALIASVAGYLLKTDDNPDGVDASVFEDMKANILKDRPHFFANFFQSFYGVGWISSPVSQEALDWSLMMTMQAGLKGTLDCVDAFGKTDFRPDLSALTVPTLVIHGTSDNTVPIDASARTVAKLVPQAELIEYSGSPHGLLLTDRDRVIEDLLRFLGTAA